MTNPFFSIIIPCYNRGSFLERTLSSVFNQKFGDFEVLIIDDGSKDDTARVVKGLQEKDPRIVYHYKENGERGAARNFGIRNSKGKFLIFFDSDDEMLPGYLAVMHAVLEKNPGLKFLAARYKFIRGNKIFSSSTTSMKAGLYDKDVVLKGNPFACNLCIANNNPGLKFFEEERSLATMEDWMFLVENLYSEKIFLVEEECLLMHQHEGRSMQQDRMLIERRLKATEILTSKISFTRKESDILLAYSYYFCSIHAFTDNDAKLAIKFIKKAINLEGLNSIFLKAYLKYIVGRRSVDRFKNLLKIGR